MRHRARFPSALLFWVITGGLLVTAGCGLLEPRPSDPPVNLSGRDFTQYADLLLELEELYTLGKPDLLPGLLPESGYRFDGDTLDSAAVHPPGRSWGRLEEIQITSRILSDTLQRIDPAHFEFTEALLFNSSDSVVMQWDYRLTRRDGTVLTGRSEFSLARKGSRFYLTRWKDRSAPPPSYSWGRWKMENL